MFGGGVPVVKLGRLAGQFAKPRRCAGWALWGRLACSGLSASEAVVSGNAPWPLLLPAALGSLACAALALFSSLAAAWCPSSGLSCLFACSLLQRAHGDQGRRGAALLPRRHHQRWVPCCACAACWWPIETCDTVLEVCPTLHSIKMTSSSYELASPMCCRCFPTVLNPTAVAPHLYAGPEFETSARIPDPWRLVRAYNQSAATLNLLRGFATGGYAGLDRVTKWSLDFMKVGLCGGGCSSGAEQWGASKGPAASLHRAWPTLGDGMLCHHCKRRAFGIDSNALQLKVKLCPLTTGAHRTRTRARRTWTWPAVWTRPSPSWAPAAST